MGKMKSDKKARILPPVEEVISGLRIRLTTKMIVMTITPIKMLMGSIATTFRSQPGKLLSIR
jgi:hypothetical protein